MRANTLAFVALAIAMMFTVSTRAADPVSSTIAIKASLQQVQVMLNRLLIGADAVLASKIEAASNEADRLLKRVAELEKQGNYDANELVNDVVRPLTLLMPEIREIVSSTERQAFLDLNVVMAGLMQTIDALPLTKVDPFIAAVNPTRISTKPMDRRITIYGFFGKPNKKYPLRMRIAGIAVTPKRVPGGRAFEIPPGIPLVEEQYVPLEFDVPDVTDLLLFDWTSYETITDRIYVQRSTPYACKYVAFLPNPQYEAVVDGDRQFHDDARTQGGGGRPSQHRTVSTQDLFIATVSTAAQYDTASAKLLEPRANIYGNAACQDHAGWSGRVVRWNADIIEYELNAPDIGVHQHSGWKDQCWEICPPLLPCYKDCKNLPYTYTHGGGGSHADIDLRPQFSVHRRGVSPVVEQPPVAFRLRRSQSLEFPLALAGDTWKVHASCRYKDGDETFDTGAIVLTAADVEETGRDVSARFADGKLYVQSRR